MIYDVIIFGAGAAGLMCACEAGKRGRSVLVLEHNEKAGEKIRISGGGRCNFTNISVGPENFISQNEHFCTSALARQTPEDFIQLVERYGINYNERKLGQLFCNGSSVQIVSMLLEECRSVNVEIRTGVEADTIEKKENFLVTVGGQILTSESLVLATGGLSIPKLGATNFGHRIARQFGLSIVEPRPGLVPLCFSGTLGSLCSELSGISIEAEVQCGKIKFRENILFTHHGMSGPAILQISSYWKEGEKIHIALRPDVDWMHILTAQRTEKKLLTTVLEQYLSGRFVELWIQNLGETKPMNRYSLPELQHIAGALADWTVIPIGTEGFGKAEVTVGGIDTNELSSKTMEAKKISGLYCIGEVVDVTGWLGGYNFQWAWSSGWVAGQFV
jgi:predicted Rossmann fold flavoprotein